MAKLSNEFVNGSQNLPGQGRRRRAAQTSAKTSAAMFGRVSACSATLAGGKIGAERQFCPAVIGWKQG
jgi:cytolysin (calcineurin-like family phosphatase)